MGGEISNSVSPDPASAYEGTVERTLRVCYPYRSDAPLKDQVSHSLFRTSCTQLSAEPTVRIRSRSALYTFHFEVLIVPVKSRWFVSL